MSRRGSIRHGVVALAGLSLVAVAGCSGGSAGPAPTAPVPGSAALAAVPLAVPDGLDGSPLDEDRQVQAGRRGRHVGDNAARRAVLPAGRRSARCRAGACSAASRSAPDVVCGLLPDEEDGDQSRRTREGKEGPDGDAVRALRRSCRQVRGPPAA